MSPTIYIQFTQCSEQTGRLLASELHNKSSCKHTTKGTDRYWAGTTDMLVEVSTKRCRSTSSVPQLTNEAIAQFISQQTVPEQGAFSVLLGPLEPWDYPKCGTSIIARCYSSFVLCYYRPCCETPKQRWETKIDCHVATGIM